MLIMICYMNMTRYGATWHELYRSRCRKFLGGRKGREKKGRKHTVQYFSLSLSLSKHFILKWKYRVSRRYAHRSMIFCTRQYDVVNILRISSSFTHTIRVAVAVAAAVIVIVLLYFTNNLYLYEHDKTLRGTGASDNEQINRQWYNTVPTFFENLQSIHTFTFTMYR